MACTERPSGRFSAAHLCRTLETQLPAGATGLVVALSGGMDSAVLLSALVQSAAQPVRGLAVRAIHVDHGLQAAAATFRATCLLLCRRLAVPLEILTVQVDAARGESLEAAARDARYGALALHLQRGECVLTAHHAVDQAETLLLQMLRGAGLKGLSGMPTIRPLGNGWQVRPLLDVAQRDLLEFGERAGLEAAMDPMNVDRRFDRSYLRAEVWPAFERRWPGAAIALARTARHAADAQSLLDHVAAQALQPLRDGAALSIAGLRALPQRQQHNAVRHWIADAGATLPSAARLTEALRQMLQSEEDHLPAVVWGEHALRRYRDRLFLTPAEPPSVAAHAPWSQEMTARLALGAGLGVLRWTQRRGGLDPSRLPAALQVRRRVGGETLRPYANAKTQTVQHLLQAQGVLPWLRDALPLVYAGDALIAVGDLWRDARWSVADAGMGVGVVWENAPILV